MKKYSIIFGLLLVCSMSASAQTSTVTVQKAYSTPYSTTYWINSYPSTPTYVTPSYMTPATSIRDNGMAILPAAKRGSSSYEKAVRKTVTLFNKSNKTPDEYDQLRSYAYQWDVIFERPKDERLREFYRFHSTGLIRLCDIFGDKPASIMESY